jgi:hypothetical protein
MMQRMMSLASIALVAAPLSAIGVANPASDRLAQLSNIQRRAALRGAIIDSGMQCIRVEKANFQGPWSNMMMWRAICSKTDPRFDYAVFVGPDASVQVRYCAEMQQLKLPRCRPFTPFTQAPKSSR